MPQITKISSQKRKKRVNVFLDGEFAFGLDVEALVKYNLKVGGRLSQTKIEKILKEGEFQKAYDQTLKFLSFRPRSEKEIQAYLTKKKVGPETKKMVISKLKQTKLLDDKEFALWWVEQRITFRPKGKIVLESELREKGIDREIIDSVLEKKLSDSFEEKLALRAAQKKMAVWQKLPPLKFHQKITAFLTRRGFSWKVIKKVVRELNTKVDVDLEKR